MRKRLVTKFILLALVMSAFAAGCGVKGKTTGENAVTSDREVLVTEHQRVLFTDSFAEMQCMAVASDVYVFGQKVSDGNTEAMVYRVESGTEEARQVACLPGEKILVWGAGENDRVAFVTFREDGKYVLHVFTKDGEESSCILDDALQSAGQFGFFLSLAVEEDSIALADTNAGMVFIIGYPEGNLIKQIPMEDYISYLHYEQDGMLMGISQTGTLYTMNPISGSREAVAENLFGSVGFPKDCFIQGKWVWISTDTALFFGALDGTETKRTIDYIAHDIPVADATDIFVEDTMEQWKIVTWSGESKQVDIYNLSYVNSGSISGNAVAKKEVITLSHYMVDSHLQEMVTAFNQSSDKYRIEVVTAGDDADWDQYMDERAMQILAGKGPDIFMATSDKRFLEYMEKGVLEDLQPYIDANLQEEEYLENALYAYKSDGKVYALEEGFRIKLVFGKEEVVGEREGWTFADLQTIMEENPQIKCFVEYFSKQTVLERCFAESGIAPSDYDAIRQCILFAQSYGQGLPPGEKAVLGENVLLMEMSLTQPWDIMDYLVTYGEDIALVGYPRQDGQGILHNSGGWSINAASENKEGAWAFLQFLLEEEHQMKLAAEDSGYFPVLREAFEKKMEVAETPKMQEVFVPEQNKYEMQEMPRYAVDGVPIYILPQNWTALIRKLAEESHVFCWEYDYGAWTIVSQEAESFFSHDKDIDAVMEIIENRMTLYLSEKE